MTCSSWLWGCSTEMIHCDKIFLFFLSLERTPTFLIVFWVQGNQYQHCDTDSLTCKWEVKKKNTNLRGLGGRGEVRGLFSLFRNFSIVICHGIGTWAGSDILSGSSDIDLCECGLSSWPYDHFICFVGLYCGTLYYSDGVVRIPGYKTKEKRFLLYFILEGRPRNIWEKSVFGFRHWTDLRTLKCLNSFVHLRVTEFMHFITA